jgi:hypothetical protein
MDGQCSTSTSTIRSLHIPPFEATSSNSSPRSSALPSPPDSPDSDSVSSFPSVSSSLFFSSAAASPPAHALPSNDNPSEGLVIPSLVLPAALKRPTIYGKTIGDIRLIHLTRSPTDSAFVQLLLDENEDVVDVGSWEQFSHGRSIRASTDWIEHSDAHGLERFEPSKNIELVQVIASDNQPPVCLIVACVNIVHRHSDQ